MPIETLGKVGTLPGSQKQSYEVYLKLKEGRPRGGVFAPQHFANYREAFAGLSKQGLGGFYKGNLLGFVHSLFTTQLRLLLFVPLEKYQSKQDQLITLATSRPTLLRFRRIDSFRALLSAIKESTDKVRPAETEH